MSIVATVPGALCSYTGTMTDIDRALAHYDANVTGYRRELEALVRIPSVSFPGFPAEEVKKSAEAVARLLARCGLERVEILEVEGAHPYVYGERIRRPGAPTILLYAHHDVQPRRRSRRPGPRPPFDPVGARSGRLYGRGAADDKAGILVHAAAVDAWCAAPESCR